MSQRIKAGDVLIIPLKEGAKFMYVLEGEKGNNIIFNLITDIPTENIQEIIQSGILFITCIFRKVLTSGEWKKIGKIDSDNPIVQYKPETFIYDVIDDYFRMGSDIGSEKFKERRTFEQIYNLERSQVYNQWHIEAILEYYCDTGFYHPRVWDFAEEEYCIDSGIKKYPLKQEHRGHAYTLRKRYGIMQNIE